MKSRIIACPNCYSGLPWNGNIEDFKCPNCGYIIQVTKMSCSLVHLFCAPSISGQRWAYEFLKFLSEHGWGDAIYIGRHDWVLAGCPTDIDDICWIIEHGNQSELSSISRLLTQQSLPPFIVQEGVKKIGLSAVTRLKRGEPDYLLRERIYYILRNFPIKEGEKILEQLINDHPDIDGDEDSPTGIALKEALIACKKIESNE